MRSVRPFTARALYPATGRRAYCCCCVDHGCGGEGACLMHRMRTPVPTVADDWRHQPRISDVASYAARVQKARPLALPLRLRGVVVSVHGPREWTVLAPLDRQGFDEYTFRVTVPPHAPSPAAIALHRPVEVVLDAYADGAWRATDGAASRTE